jgi:hypothetical protein
MSSEGLGDAGDVLVSCSALGDCTAGGSIGTSNGGSTAFVVTETGGKWSTARHVTGLPTFTTGMSGASVESVSCASPGNCGVGGYDVSGDRKHQRAFVVDQAGGTWRKAEAVPGLAALDTGRSSQVAFMSCASAGSRHMLPSSWASLAWWRRMLAPSSIRQERRPAPSSHHVPVGPAHAARYI